ncbi:PPE family protein [Mycobacterium scrofulaceum]|uniref:PPE domain-containing protein n=1 Tax=Mycobacterium scrofulaceum TaxID=1783 RepID=A0A1X0K7X2_MYCSC|nr:PPE family protein [Mycobacterium scrofulaceum]ORB71230.1 hypothetical protein BST44_21985 [Mycobacterium scrofulaceum]
MDFALLPPEVNSALMYAGPGSGPMLAAATGWDAVAAGLESAAGGYSSAAAGLSGLVWSGPSSMLMAAAVTPYVAWLQAGAAQAAQTAGQAYAAAAAYEPAFAMTVPPPVIAANRAQLMALVATNFFGQNTPAIMATEGQYAEMWTQDATAMYGYAAASSAAGALAPFTAPPRTTNSSGQADQARALTQATGNATSARTQSLVQMASTNTTQHAAATTGGVDPPLPPGSSANIAPGGATVHTGVSVTVSNGYPVDFVSGTSAANPTTVYIPSGTATYVLSDGTVGTLQAGHDALPLNTSGSILSGTFQYTGAGVGGHLSVPGGSVTGTPGTVGGYVTENAAGLVTDLNLSSGSQTFFTTGPTVVTPVTPTSSTPLAAAPAASSPGLAGNAGIQPQLNAEALAEWARSMSGGELATDLAAAH